MTIINKVSSKSVMPGVTAIPDVVDAPTIGAATDVGTSRAYNNGAATVAFTAAATGGAATSYTAISTPGSFTATGASSPLTVTGLASATSYTFKTYGTNASGTWSAIQSSASNSITATTVPQAPTIGTFTDGGTGTTGTLSFTSGATGGSSITGYKYSTDGSTYTSASGTTSPLSLTGLTAGTYTFTLKATNANGDSSASSGVSGTVIQPVAFNSLASTTLSTNTNTITFSSIPSGYQHLQLRLLCWGGSTIRLRFNNDSGASQYRTHQFIGQGSSVYSQNNGPTTSIICNGQTGLSAGNGWPSVTTIDIHEYLSTSQNKVAKIFFGKEDNGTTNGSVEMNSGLWYSTAAINRIDIINGDGSQFTSGSVFSLYGIKG